MPEHVMDDGLYAEESRLENESRSEGIARYRIFCEKAIQRGAGPQLKAVERLLVHWFTPLRRLIAQEKKVVSEGRPGPFRSIYGPIIVRFNSARMALATMHEVMQSLLAEPAGLTPVRIALAIARALNAEENYREMRRLNNETKRVWKAKGCPDRFKPHERWDALMHTHRRRVKVKNVNRVAARYEPAARWPLSTQLRVGTCLLELFSRICTVNDYDQPFEDALYRSKRMDKGHAKWFWRISDACREKINDGHDFRKLLSPRFLPMVVPPIRWTADTPGGYLKLPTNLMKRLARHTKGVRENEVLREAVNVINSTPWRINRWMLDIVKKLADAGGDMAGVPRLTKLEFPPRPQPFTKDNPERAKWKKRAGVILRRNLQITSIARTFLIKLQAAERVRDYDRIYFPHQCDFRTRLYPIPTLFHHQSDDVCRGLLEFAEPRTVDDNAVRWLKIHLANCCGHDKLPFAERIAWVDSSLDALAGWVADPLVNTGWMQQEEPFQALAAARAIIDPEAGAYLPVQVDGSNNALQHYAAMIRCADAARMVNVLPTGKPEDFYQIVTGHVEAMVGEDADKGVEVARVLDGYITRKIVKRTAMTNYYGVTAVGARDQMYDSLREAGLIEDELSRGAKYMSLRTLAATERSCPTVQGALKWLRTCASAIASRNLPVEWTTPLGVVCQQPYRNGRHNLVATPFGRMVLSNCDETCPVSPRKQVNAFAPNFVHSVDASHLMCTALGCADKGVRFAGVHDSLWTHAADMDALRQVALEQFTLIHAEPLLEVLHHDLTARYKLKFPAPPALGTLDIAQAGDSEYMFS